jgi:hypothetical protein
VQLGAGGQAAGAVGDQLDEDLAPDAVGAGDATNFEQGRR